MTDPDDILRQAIGLHQAGNLAGAEKMFRDALATGIDHKNMYIGLAAVCDAQGHGQDARAALEEAVVKYPEAPSVLSNLGSILIRAGEPAAAIPLLLKATALAPEFPGGFQNLAVAYAEMKDWQRAKAAADIVLSSDPHSIVMLKMVAQIDVEFGQFSRGLTAYDRLASLCPLDYRPPSPRSGLDVASTYSRAYPSPRYAELSEQYRLMHAKKPTGGSKVFAGVMTFLRIAPYLRRYFEHKSLNALLDYGGGHGIQYNLTDLKDCNGTSISSMTDFLGVGSVQVYDAGQPQTEVHLDQHYDAVICTDVLEHCDRQDLPWIVHELFEHAEKAVFATIATYPAQKHLPNGENAHCTLEASDWWSVLFMAAAKDFPNTDYGYLVDNGKGFENFEAFSGGPNTGAVGAQT